MKSFLGSEICNFFSSWATSFSREYLKTFRSLNSVSNKFRRINQSLPLTGPLMVEENKFRPFKKNCNFGSQTSQGGQAIKNNNQKMEIKVRMTPAGNELSNEGKKTQNHKYIFLVVQ